MSLEKAVDDYEPAANDARARATNKFDIKWLDEQTRSCSPYARVFTVSNRNGMTMRIACVESHPVIVKVLIVREDPCSSVQAGSITRASLRIARTSCLPAAAHSWYSCVPTPVYCAFCDRLGSTATLRF